MRNRMISMTAALALTITACGGSDSADPTTTEAATQATTATTAAASTTTAAPATTAAPTTTEAATDPTLEAALAAAGTYTGSWTNTTFGSTGDAGMTLTVADNGDVTMDWDLGGFVFGASDPDSEIQTLNVSELADGMTLTTALFGDVEISVSDDFTTMTMTAADVPTAGIATFSATTTWVSDGMFEGTYEVGFEGGGDPAEGTFEMTRS